MVTAASLKAQVLSGVVWNFGELILRRGASAMTTLILAWFLVPEDFGLMAMMVVFLAMANAIVDGGLSQALIRKESVSARALSTAFFTNVAAAVLAYVLLFACAPLIAEFYAQPRLVVLLRVASLAILFDSLAMVQRAVLARELKFYLQMRVTLPAAIISGLAAIAMGYAGYGVWALVTQILVMSASSTLLFWRVKIWRPTMEFGGVELRELFQFGGYLLAARLTDEPFRNMYVIVIAKLFPTAVAGYYFFAERIRELLIAQLVRSVQNVTFPALATVQNDPDKLKRGCREVVRATTFLVLPALLIIAALSASLFRVVVPELWYPAQPYFQLMCISVLLSPLHYINVNILKVTGRSDLVLYLGFVRKGVAIAILVVSYRFGVIGILLGQIVSSALAYIPNSYYAKRLIGYSVKEQLIDFLPVLGLAGLVGMMLWIAEGVLDWGSVGKVVGLGGGGVVVYLGLAYVFRLRAFYVILTLLKDKVNAYRERGIVDGSETKI